MEGNRKLLPSLKWYYSQKSPYLFFLHFESMIYKYLPWQIVGNDFDEKSEFLEYARLGKDYDVKFLRCLIG